MGTLATLALAVVLPLAAADAPPSHEEIVSHAVRIVDAPDDGSDDLNFTPDPRSADVEIVCPPPSRLRCWMATAQATDDSGAPSMYCRCSK